MLAEATMPVSDRSHYTPAPWSAREIEAQAWALERARRKWAQKQANGKRFPFWGMAVPLDERCKGWEPREGEGGAQ